MTHTTPQTPPSAGPALTERAEGRNLLRGGLKRASSSVRALGTLAALGLIWLYFSLESQYFFTTANIWNILLQSANVPVSSKS